MRAFNIETGLIGDQMKVQEGALIQIRFQWWRDAINQAYSGAGKVPSHPVVQALAHVLQQHPGLPKYHFKKIIDAREQDLLDPQPPLTVEGLEQYAESTASRLHYLQLAALGLQNREADHAASHLGKAVGITTLLRGTAFHAQQRRSYLPMDACAEKRWGCMAQCRVQQHTHAVAVLLAGIVAEECNLGRMESSAIHLFYLTRSRLFTASCRAVLGLELDVTALSTPPGSQLPCLDNVGYHKKIYTEERFRIV